MSAHQDSHDSTGHLPDTVRTAFGRTLWKGPAGRILLPGRPLFLCAWDAPPGCGPDSDWEADRYDEVTEQWGLVDGQEGARRCLYSAQGEWPRREILDFEWDSFGPMSWYACITVTELASEPDGHSFWVVVPRVEEVGDEVVAALELDTSGTDGALSDLVCELFRWLIRTNGGSEERGLFGSLPTRTLNRVPQMIPRGVVAEAYAEWQNEFGEWHLLRDSVIYRALEPDHLKRCLALLERVGSEVRKAEESGDMLRWLEERAREEEESVTDEEREILIQLYLDQGYRELWGLAPPGER